MRSSSFSSCVAILAIGCLAAGCARNGAGGHVDLVVLSKDILIVEPAHLLSTRVDYTMFNGKIIYDADASSDQFSEPHTRMRPAGSIKNTRGGNEP